MTQAMAEAEAEAAFDFFTRLGAPYFAFHDADVMADAATLEEHDDNLKRSRLIAKKMAKTKVKLLWGTANLFSHPRLCRRRRDQSRSGSLCLCRRAGAQRSWKPHTGWAARTTCCGAAAKVTTRCSTPT